MQYVFNNLPWIVPSESDCLKRIYQDLGVMRYVKKNSVLKFPGEENKLFYIKSGVCFAYINTYDDKLLTVGVLLSSRAVGDITVMTGERVNMTIVAKRNTEALVVSPSDFKAMVMSKPSLIAELARTIVAKRNCHMEGLIANLTMPLEERLKFFFLSSLIACNKNIDDDMIELPMSLSNEDLATITYSTRVSISRIISKWIQEGLAVKNGGYHKFIHKSLFNGMKGWKDL